MFYYNHQQMQQLTSSTKQQQAPGSTSTVQENTKQKHIACLQRVQNVDPILNHICIQLPCVCVCVGQSSTECIVSCYLIITHYIVQCKLCFTNKLAHTINDELITDLSPSFSIIAVVQSAVTQLCISYH